MGVKIWAEDNCVRDLGRPGDSSSVCCTDSNSLLVCLLIMDGRQIPPECAAALDELQGSPTLFG